MTLVKYFAASCALLLVALATLAEITKAPPGSFKLVPSPLFTNSILPQKSELPSLPLKKLDEFSSLPPGVYVTEPYACMVKIPGAAGDDIARLEHSLPTNAMPILRPELRPKLPADSPK